MGRANAEARRRRGRGTSRRGLRGGRRRAQRGGARDAPSGRGRVQLRPHHGRLASPEAHRLLPAVRRAAAPGGWVSEELGVELAAFELRDGVEDVALTRIAALRRCFRRRWIGSHPAASSVRRGAAAAAATRGGGGGGAGAHPFMSPDLSPKTAVTRRRRRARSTSTPGPERWRLCSSAGGRDGRATFSIPESWERGWRRAHRVGAFNGHAPHSLVRGKTVRDLLERRQVRDVAAIEQRVDARGRVDDRDGVVQRGDEPGEGKRATGTQPRAAG